MDPDPFRHNEEDCASPLRSVCSDTMSSTSPCRYTAVTKQDFELLTSGVLKNAQSESCEASRSRGFAPSPLYTIPLHMYSRFPRFSTTTENSTPDFSTEEVTSTRLSIDEQDIVRTPESPTPAVEVDGKRQKSNTMLHKAISTPSFSLRQVKDRLWRVPSITLSGKTLRQEAKSTSEEQSQCNLDQVSGTDSTSTSCSAHRSLGSSVQENGTLRFKRSSKELLIRAYSRLSTLTERKAENEPSIYQTGPNPVLDEPLESPQPLSFGALKAFDDFVDPSVTSFNSYHTALDHFSYQTCGSFARPSLVAQEYSVSGPNSPRRMISGSIDELRSNSFLAASQRTFAFSGITRGGSSMVNLDQRLSQASRVRPVTLHDVEDVRSLNQLRQDPLFVDMPNGHQTNFIFPPLAEKSSAPVVPQSVRNSKTRSFRNLRQHQTLPLLIRSTSMKHAPEHENYQQKVPLYTPSQIIRPRGTVPFFPRRTSSLSPVDTALQAWDGMNDGLLDASELPSTNSLSNASKWSTTEDRAHGRDPDHPSLRSEDPSVKSVDAGSWWKSERFRAVMKKVIPRRQALEIVNAPEAPSQSETEKDSYKQPFRKTCEVYGRRVKQKLRGTYWQHAVEKEACHDVGQ